MPSIIFNNTIKKKFEGIRGKFLSTGLFMNLTREETLELMIDVINKMQSDLKNSIIPPTPFNSIYIEEILEKRKEQT